MIGRVTNVASVPHRSPFRYPGGKTWLVPQVRRWVASLDGKPKVFCEPFCGGAIASLSVLFDGLVDHIQLVELDEDVAAVWKTILDDGPELIKMIARFELSPASVRRVLSESNLEPTSRAFAAVVRNRVQRGGIMAPGASFMKNGENGRGIASRWYPQTLIRRISSIYARRHQIAFHQGDGIEWMGRHTDDETTIFFIDPPYTVAGRRLYRHSDVDHNALFRMAGQLRGDFLMTYDDAEAIRELTWREGFDSHVVAMKNTHHRIMSELLIGRDLSWARAAEPIKDSLLEDITVDRIAGGQRPHRLVQSR